MTKPTGRPRGRPPKPRKPKGPAHRPTPNFWRDRDRLHYAFALHLVARGESMRRALFKAAMGQRLWPFRRPQDKPKSEPKAGDPLTYRGLWVYPEPKDLARINRERRRAPRDKPLGHLSVLACMPPRPGDISLVNRIRGWEIKLKAYRRDPIIEAWLSIMAGFFCSRLQWLPPMSSIEAAAMGARVEAWVKTAADRISA